MIVRLRPGMMVVTATDDDGAADLEDWLATHRGRAFVPFAVAGRAVTVKLADHGELAVLRGEALNVVSRSEDGRARLISNLAATPFSLDGADYASVEGFWQGLKFDDECNRTRIAGLAGLEAKRAGEDAPEDRFVGTYRGETFRVGTHEHWALMERACTAKFEQHEAARAALLATGERRLEHRVKHDSKTIPGVVMAEIWMRIREQITAAAGKSSR